VLYSSLFLYDSFTTVKIQLNLLKIIPYYINNLSSRRFTEKQDIKTNRPGRLQKEAGITYTKGRHTINDVKIM
jgi:hypothetical protein